VSVVVSVEHSVTGVDLRTAQELLAYNVIAMTVRYAHLAPKYTLAAVERLDAQNPRTRTEAGYPESKNVRPRGSTLLQPAFRRSPPKTRCSHERDRPS
jgi:hypothetical protein